MIDTRGSGVTSSGDSSLVLPLGVLGAVILVLVLGALAMRGFSGSRPSNWETLNREKIAQQWRELEALLKMGAPGRKLAIIEADKLLDRVLRGVGFPGETFAERLKVAEYKHPKLKEVWDPHRLRNRLVHEESYAISERETEKSLAIYKRALHSLRML